MNDIKKLKEQHQEDHPAFGSYLECMTRTLFGGLATFCLVFSSTYFAQRSLMRYLPYTEKSYILFSSVFSASSAYYLTSLGTKNCQSAWLAAEDKVTYFSEQTSNEN